MLTAQDASMKYVSWLNDKEINQYLESRFINHTIHSVEQYINQVNASNNEYLFGMFTKSADVHIGNIKLGPINTVHHYADIGLMIGDKNYWGKGIGSEAIGLITSFAFRHLNLHKVKAGCYESNIGSLKAFLKTGFKEEGFLRNQVLFNNEYIGCHLIGLLRDEWLHES